MRPNQGQECTSQWMDDEPWASSEISRVPFKPVPFRWAFQKINNVQGSLDGCQCHILQAEQYPLTELDGRVAQRSCVGNERGGTLLAGIRIHATTSTAVRIDSLAVHVVAADNGWLNWLNISESGTIESNWRREDRSAVEGQ